MSRITFSDLYSDYLDVNTSVEDCKKMQKVEIVPRGMVEIIIKKCDEEINFCSQFKGNEYYDGKVDCASYIKHIAKMLLQEFEDNGKI